MGSAHPIFANAIPEKKMIGGFGLVVDMDVRVAGLSQADAEKVVAAGHQASYT